jgi:hypothetical protein
MEEDAWYSDRRASWQPDRVRLLLIAESAPDDGGDVAGRRFFYDTRLTRHDNLFRETVRSLYAPESLKSGPDAKRPWLQRLKDDGVFLIDLAPVPVNYSGAIERKAHLAENIADVVRRAKGLQADGIILIKQNIFELLASPLRAASLPLLHDEFIPFPGSGQQRRFRERFATAVQRLDRI